MNGSQPAFDLDNNDARQRQRDPDNESASSRKVSSDNVHFKILVPSIAAGAIIGKGGEAIEHIQKETGARVKMSKANDCYPGTTERVCLIQGSVEAISKVLYYIMDRILEKPDQNPKAATDGRPNSERHKQVKILVPNSTAGMIIGKEGAFVKEIKKQSGAYVQVSQKSKEVNLPERCVTVAGDAEQNRRACHMILIKISEDPQSTSCPNISYGDVTGPVASAFPTGSPYATSGSGCASSSVMSPSGASGGVCSPQGMGAIQGAPPMANEWRGNSSAAAMAAAAASLNSSLNSSGGLTALKLDSLIGSLRSSGFAEEAVSEIVNALCVLTHYGFFNLSTLGPTPGLTPTAATPVPLVSPGSSFNFGLSASLNIHPQHPGPLRLEEYNSPLGPGAAPYQDPNRGHMHQQQHQYLSGPYASPPAPMVTRDSMMGLYQQSPQHPPPIHMSQQHQGSQQQGDYLLQHHPSVLVQGASGGAMMEAMTGKDIEVPEHLIGVIMGQQGKAVADLQSQTRTTIQISKKGQYSPGTKNRIVSILGPAENVNRAASHISQQVQYEDARRQIHHQVTGGSENISVPPPSASASVQRRPGAVVSIVAATGGIPVTSGHGRTASGHIIDAGDTD